MKCPSSSGTAILATRFKSAAAAHWANSRKVAGSRWEVRRSNSASARVPGPICFPDQAVELAVKRGAQAGRQGELDGHEIEHRGPVLRGQRAAFVDVFQRQGGAVLHGGQVAYPRPVRIQARIRTPGRWVQPGQAFDPCPGARSAAEACSRPVGRNVPGTGGSSDVRPLVPVTPSGETGRRRYCGRFWPALPQRQGGVGGNEYADTYDRPSAVEAVCRRGIAPRTERSGRTRRSQ